MDRHPSVAHVGREARRYLIAIALAALVAAAFGPVALAAQPAPGNNGTVKIHEGEDEPATVVRTDPHVCTFHLHFFFADAGDSGAWEIQEWAPGNKGTVILTGTYQTDANGVDRDPDAGTYSLPNGHYKLFWDGDRDATKHDKHKVFWVECEAQGGVAPTQGTNPTPPGGGVAPTQGTNPTPPGGGVGGATGTPTPTLPPTDTTDQPTAGSAGLWATLVLLLLAVVAAVALSPARVFSAWRARRHR